jgi:hypothetical protein
LRNVIRHYTVLYESYKFLKFFYKRIKTPPIPWHSYMPCRRHSPYHTWLRPWKL